MVQAHTDLSEWLSAWLLLGGVFMAEISHGRPEGAA